MNTIIINWISLEQFGLYPTDLITLGDDSFISTSRRWDLKWCGEFVKKIGMELNLQKCDQRQDLDQIKFLGYHIGKGQPYKPHSEWMAALLFPENPDKSFSDLQNRALGLYYANMCVDIEFATITRTIIKFKPFDIAVPPNFERMLRQVGIALSSLDPINLPDPLYFTKFF